MAHLVDFTPLFIIFIFAFFVPIISEKIKFIKIPWIIIEIIVGMFLGYAFPDIITLKNKYIHFLYLFGFSYLMFLSGYEIDFEYLRIKKFKGKITLKKILKNNLLSSIIIFTLTLFLSYLTSLVFLHFKLIQNAEFMTLILSTTSVGIVLPTLKEKHLLSSKYGQHIMVVSLIYDILTLFLLGVETLFLTNLLKGTPFSLPNLLKIFIPFLAVYIIYKIGRKLSRSSFIKQIFSPFLNTSSELKLRGAIAIMTFFLVLSQWMGVEVILGAFLAGALLSALSYKEGSSLSHKLDTLGYGFFIPIFFIMVGTTFDLKKIASSTTVMLLILFVIAATFLVKIIPSFILIPIYGFRKTLAGGFLISAKLSLMIAASEIGRSLNIISDAIHSAIIVIAIIASTVSPIIFNRLYGEDKEEKGFKVIIIGAGKVGRSLALRLKRLNIDYVLVDRELGACEKSKKLGLNVLKGDAVKPFALKKINPSESDYLVSLTGEDSINLAVCKLARKLFGMENLIARDNNPKNSELFQKYGILPLNLVENIAISIENLILRPDIFDTFLKESYEREFLEIKLTNPSLKNLKISQLPYIGERFVMVLIKRGENFIFPKGDEKLKLGDIIVSFGSHMDLIKAKELFEKKE